MKIKQILIIALLLGCKPKAEFYINGRAYYTHSRCLETKHESKYGYHYGYNPMRGKFEGYFGSYTETTCIKTKIDTIEIKP